MFTVIQTKHEELAPIQCGSLKEAVLTAVAAQGEQEKKTTVEIRRGDEVVAKLLESGTLLLKSPAIAEAFA